MVDICKLLSFRFVMDTKTEPEQVTKDHILVRLDNLRGVLHIMADDLDEKRKTLQKLNWSSPQIKELQKWIELREKHTNAYVCNVLPE